MAKGLKTILNLDLQKYIRVKAVIGIQVVPVYIAFIYTLTL
jgi:hypothetical protein